MSRADAILEGDPDEIGLIKKGKSFSVLGHVVTVVKVYPNPNPKDHVKTLVDYKIGSKKYMTSATDFAATYIE